MNALPKALEALGAYDQFMLYKLVPRPAGQEGMDKLPTSPLTGRTHDAHDSTHWVSFEAAAQALSQFEQTGQAHGIAFTVTDACPFFFIDIDKCLVNGVRNPTAAKLERLFKGAAVEVSQSGNGLHILGTGKAGVPADRKVKAGTKFDLYTQKRFVALTGTEAAGDAALDCSEALDLLVAEYLLKPDAAPAAATDSSGRMEGWDGYEDDDELIAHALRTVGARVVFGKPTFSQLWTADAEALARCYPPDNYRADSLGYDASKVDGAMAKELCFWTGKDAARIERLMWMSSLARDKWSVRPEYLTNTIQGAMRLDCGVFKKRGKSVTPVTARSFEPAAMNAAQLDETGRNNAKPTPLNAAQYLLTQRDGPNAVAFDTFRSALMTRDQGRWRPFEDEDYFALRVRMEHAGFQTVPHEIAKSAVSFVARECKFDSALEWAATLQWDGVPRIDTAMTAYYGVEDSTYVRAVGAYLFTALAGRLLTPNEPGCQADMVPILVGLQGARKTSAVRALSPSFEAFSSIDLAGKDEENSRKLRGVLVVELSEMRGLAGRDKEATKDWVSRRVEKWRPVYREMTISFARRCIFLGTSNTRELLDDETGERRWLPMEAGRADVDALERDRDQLWAEGVARYRANGVEWETAETLAKERHAAFKIVDDWEEPIRQWLDERRADGDGTHGEQPFTNGQVLQRALGVQPHLSKGRDGKRVAKILTRFGYLQDRPYVDGVRVRAWRKP